MSFLAALPLLPLAGSASLLALRRRERLLGPLAVGAMAVTFIVALVAAAAQPTAAWPWGAGIELRLAATGPARVVAPLVAFIAAPILLYAAAHQSEGVPRLLAWMCAFVGAMEVLVLAADLLTLLVGFELVAVCSWVLIAHDWRDPSDGRDAARAFLTVRFGDLALYLAAGLVFAATGSFAFEALTALPRPLLDVVALGVLVAAAAKSAQLPFSPWLFAAMAGPTPVSALLHSATMVSAGAYALMRLAPAFEPTGWFSPAVALLGLATALAAGGVAALHPHVKKTLAASTSAQYGLVFLAVGAGSTAAAGAHLVAHAAFKALLFLGAGVAIHAAGTKRLDRMGLGTALPRAAWLFAAGALALAAVPPLGGAWTKEEIVRAAGETSPW
ncbi:MAG: proton-conducting transporter membrane subunit, partial [Gemmatimonadota bacterium]